MTSGAIVVRCKNIKGDTIMAKFEEIKMEMFKAMKAKDKTKTEVFKSVINHAQSIVKEKMVSMSDDIVSQAVILETKQLNQTIDSIKDRPDCELYKSSVEKKKIIEPYLPKMMDKTEIRHELYCVFEKLNITEPKKSDKGKIMKALMLRIKGKADGKIVNEVLNEYLK